MPPQAWGAKLDALSKPVALLADGNGDFVRRLGLLQVCGRGRVLQRHMRTRPHVWPGHTPGPWAAAGAPPSRTKWTRRVPHPVLIGHAASLRDLARAPALLTLPAASQDARRGGMGQRSRRFAALVRDGVVQHIEASPARAAAKRRAGF